MTSVATQVPSVASVPGGRFRAAMRHYPAAPVIIVSDGGQVRVSRLTSHGAVLTSHGAVDDSAFGPVGMTATSFTTISLEPALVGVAFMHGSATLERVRGQGRCSVNILTSAQSGLVARFGYPGPRRALEPDEVDWVAGVAVLRGCAASLRCRVGHVTTIGDHDFVVLVVEGVEGSGDGTASGGLVCLDGVVRPVPPIGGLVEALR